MAVALLTGGLQAALPWNTAPGSLAREAALGPALLLPHYRAWPFLGSFTL